MEQILIFFVFVFRYYRYTFLDSSMVNIQWQCKFEHTHTHTQHQYRYHHHCQEKKSHYQSILNKIGIDKYTIIETIVFLSFGNFIITFVYTFIGKIEWTQTKIWNRQNKWSTISMTHHKVSSSSSSGGRSMTPFATMMMMIMNQKSFKKHYLNSHHSLRNKHDYITTICYFGLLLFQFYNHCTLNYHKTLCLCVMYVLLTFQQVVMSSLLLLLFDLQLWKKTTTKLKTPTRYTWWLYIYTHTHRQIIAC